MKPNAGTITAYSDALSPERRRAFETLRAMIEKAAPQAKGSMKIGLPSWELRGPLFALASQPQRLELYVAEPDLIAKRKKTLGEVDLGKASIRFKRIEDLNLDAVAALLEEAAERRR